jgi:hypothetical protein
VSRSCWLSKAPRIRVGLCALAVALLAPAAAVASAPASPYSNGHPYRHGAVPFRGLEHNPVGTGSANNLSFQGGIGGVGVTTGAPTVYVVFWGSQWGTQSTNSSGHARFSGDPQGVAPYLEAFLKGLGTGGETWSGVMTQYCQGVALGSQSCPSNAAHVGYPTGGALRQRTSFQRSSSDTSRLMA